MSRVLFLLIFIVINTYALNLKDISATNQNSVFKFSSNIKHHIKEKKDKSFTYILINNIENLDNYYDVLTSKNFAFNINDKTLLLRFPKDTKMLVSKDNKELTFLQNFEKPSLGMEDNRDFLVNYSYIIFVLVLLIITLFLLKKLILTKNKSLINSNSFKNDLDIISKKYIDKNNGVTLIRFKKRVYLVLFGNSSVVIDKFESKASFQKALKEQQHKIDETLAK